MSLTVPLHLAVREAASRFAPLPLTEKYALRLAWSKAFGTKD